MIDDVDATPTERTKKAGPMVIDGVLYGMDAHVATWVQMKLGHGPVEVPFTALGILTPEAADAPISNDEPLSLAAGAYFFNHVPKHDMDVCVAADDLRSGHPRIIRKILEFPFGELDLPRITAYIHASNTTAIESAQKLGFQIEGEKRGTGVKMLGLLRSECWVWNKVPQT
jgi:hypothetical protein